MAVVLTGICPVRIEVSLSIKPERCHVFSERLYTVSVVTFHYICPFSFRIWLCGQELWNRLSRIFQPKLAGKLISLGINSRIVSPRYALNINLK